MKRLCFASLLAVGCIAQAGTVDSVRSDVLKVNKPARIKKSQIQRNTRETQAWWDVRKAGCLKDELQAYEVERTLLKPWRQAWISKNISAFLNLTEKAFSQTAIFALSSEKTKDLGGIQAAKWNLENLLTLTEGLNQYKKIEDVELTLTNYNIDFDKRSDNYLFDQFEGTVQFDLRGLDKAGKRRTDRGTWRAAFKRTGKGWQLSALRPLEGEILVANRDPLFVEETKEKGLDQLPVYLRTEAIRRGGYALAMADINKDGINDMLIGSRDKTSLLLGQKTGGFKDVTSTSGIGQVKFTKTAIFADLRNSGIQDLVLLTLIPGDKANVAGPASVLVFHGDGKGSFKAVPQEFATKRAALQPMPAAVADFNGDGFLDLYVGYPGIRDFTVFQDRQEPHDMQGFYLNDGNGSFKDFTDKFKTSDFARMTKLYPHSSMAVNLDQKEGVDLIVIDDRNNLSPIYMNNGKADFKQMAEPIGLGNKGYGMSVGAADFDNDGITDIAMSNVNFTAGSRAVAACSRHWDLAPISYKENGLRLFKGVKDAPFTEVSKTAGLEHAVGQGAAGFTFLDYDNDGLLDLYVVNGLWSGNPAADDVSSLFLNHLSFADANLREGLKEDHLIFKKFLAEMQGEISAEGKFTAIKGMTPNMLGYQHNRLMRNNGDGTFTDVAYLEGVDAIGDGYVVGNVMNADGTQDLVLRNGDPGTTAVKAFPVVQYFRNTSKAKDKSVQLTFEGTRSNKDAIGTYAVATFKNETKQVQHLVANSGSLQNERKIRFVSDNTIPEITVHWPSGSVQTLKNLKPGSYHVKEDDSRLLRSAL